MCIRCFLFRKSVVIPDPRPGRTGIDGAAVKTVVIGGRSFIFIPEIINPVLIGKGVKIIHVQRLILARNGKAGEQDEDGFEVRVFHKI